MNKKSWLFKKVSLATCLLLIVQLVFGAVFSINLANAQSLVIPSLAVEKTAISNSCEEAEITLKIMATGTPFQERKPIDVIFVIDRSSSMDGLYLANVKVAVNNFIDQMDFSSGEPDRVGIVSYAGYEDNPSVIDYPFGSDGLAAQTAVNDIEVGVGTCIECGLRTAYNMLNGANEQFVILLSDGVANVKDPGTHDTSHVCNYGTPEMNCPVTDSVCTDNAVDWGTNIKNDHATTIYSIGYRLSDIDSACSNSGQTSALAEQTLKNISSNPVGYYYSGDPNNINTVFDEIAYKINNIAAYSPVVIEVLPIGITYDSMIGGLAPSSVNGQTIVWEFGNMIIGDSQTVEFLVRTTSNGHDGLVDVYPDTRVEYRDVQDDLQVVPFPETSLTVDSCTQLIATSTISGYKYNDLNNNGLLDDGGVIVSDWEIRLIGCPYPPLNLNESQFLANTHIDLDPVAGTSGACILMSTTTTDSMGYYEFSNLISGDYGVSEATSTAWQQSYPFNDQFYYFNLNQSTTTINFANYLLPYCGDGDCDSGIGENCETCYEDCGSCGGGNDNYCGDGQVNQTNEECDDGNQVDGDGCDRYCQIELYCGDGTCNGDETCSTCREDCGSCSSGGGSTPLCILRGDCESNYTPPAEDLVEEASDEVLVLGEEGVPSLTITKGTNVAFANPGEILNYSILITNNGNLEAFNVSVEDTLPAGLVFAEDESMIYTWVLGDIPIGESRDANYQVKVLMDAVAGIYVNTVVASADNHDDISTTADIEVQIVEVLAETGMDLGELAFLLMFSLMSIILGRKLDLESLA